MLFKILTTLFLVSCISFFEKDKIIINQGKSSTFERKIKIHLHFQNKEDISAIMLANNSDFEHIYWMPYQDSLNWELPENYGQHFIYLKYRNPWTSTCPILSASIVLAKK